MSVEKIELSIENVAGLCPAGEVFAAKRAAEGAIPVFSCEGPCIRGEIARLAANIVAREAPGLARACHAETLFVPHSKMADWVKNAERAVIIDGCFLKCQGRAMAAILDEAKITHFDVLPMHKRYGDVFLMDDVPEDERKAVARQVADTLVGRLTSA